MPIVQECAAEGCKTLTMGRLCVQCESAERSEDQFYADAPPCREAAELELAALARSNY